MPREPTQAEREHKQNIEKKLQEMKKQQEERALISKQLIEDMKKREEERKESSKKLNEAFDTLKKNMHEILTRREKEVNAFYDQLDKWENEVALTKKDRCKVLCEKLEQLPPDDNDQFFTLQYFIGENSSWKFDRTTPEYANFMSFKEEDQSVDLNELKKAALGVLKQLDFEGIRRFIDEIIGDGVSETHFVFC